MRHTFLVIVGIFIGSASIIGALDQDYPTVSLSELKYNASKIRTRQWLLINILPRDIFLDCSIPGSVNIPTHMLTKKLASVKNHPRDRKIIIYCAGKDCPLSKYAYQELVRMGFTDVRVFPGGMREWVQKGMAAQGICKSGYLLD